MTEMASTRRTSFFQPVARAGWSLLHLTVLAGWLGCSGPQPRFAADPTGTLDESVDPSPNDDQADNNETSVAAVTDEMELAVHWSLALALTEENEYAAAWPHVQAVLAVQDDAWSIHLAAAQICLYWSLDGDCVRRHALRSLELHPDDARARTFLGQVAQDEGDLDEAVHHYRAALAERPGEAAVAMLLAGILEQRGERSEAIGILTQALDSNPEDVRIMLHLAAMTEASDPVRAEELFRRAAETSEDPVFALRHLLRFYERQGRSGEANDIRRYLEEQGQDRRQMRPIR